MGGWGQERDKRQRAGESCSLENACHEELQKEVCIILNCGLSQ